MATNRLAGNCLRQSLCGPNLAVILWIEGGGLVGGVAHSKHPLLLTHGGSKRAFGLRLRHESWLGVCVHRGHSVTCNARTYVFGADVATSMATRTTAARVAATARALAATRA